MACGAAFPTPPYYANMPRKKPVMPNRGAAPDWYLPEWMATLRVSQAELARRCGLTPSTVHGIYHGRTSYYRDLVNMIASKLSVQPYELLMPPEMAMALRRQREDALRIVEGTAPLLTGTDQ